MMLALRAEMAGKIDDIRLLQKVRLGFDTNKTKSHRADTERRETPGREVSWAKKLKRFSNRLTGS